MKPMLASPADLAKLKYPVLASPKLDGVRCLIMGGVAMSRNFKPIPNKWVQACFGRKDLNGLDGELIVGGAMEPGVFQRTSSGVMSVDGKPEAWFHVFDKFDHDGPFRKRLQAAGRVIDQHGHGPLELVKHISLLNEPALLKHEALYLSEGYEGLMIRDPAGPYKHGRSTTNEGWLLKLKRFEDSEAEITGYACLMHNDNEVTVNKLGRKERSSHQAGKVAMDTLGSVTCVDLKTGVEFEIGTGFTAEQRKLLWVGRAKLKGRIAKYKFQPVGVKEKPRFPVFLGFRDKSDL